MDIAVLFLERKGVSDQKVATFTNGIFPYNGHLSRNIQLLLLIY